MADAPPMMLPKGRYWIDVSNEPVPQGTMQGFLSAFKDSVHVESTEDDGEFSWYLFTTSKDLVFPGGIGEPTKAGPAIKSRADTVKRPDPIPDATDVIPTASDVGKGIANAANTLVWIVGIGIALALILRAKGNSSPSRV